MSFIHATYGLSVNMGRVTIVGELGELFPKRN
jgi:hypothetical protein